MAETRNFQDFMTKQLQQKQLQAKLENIFTSSRVPGTYLRNPEPTRAGKMTDILSSGLEWLGFGGQNAYKGANTLTSLTPAASLDDLDRGDPTSALESVAGGPAQAMFVGPMARGIDKLALKEAQGMSRALIRNPNRAKRIFKDTGWLQGRDDKWRTEIDDSASRLHGNRSAGLGADDIGTVGFSPDMRNPDLMHDVFTHAKLYEAYPQLAEYGVTELDPAMAAQGYSGSFGPTNKKLAATVAGGLPSHNVTMASGAFGDVPGGNPRKTMLHELQHAVQGIEGFEGGASPDWVKSMASQGTISKDTVKPFWQRAIERGYNPKVAMDKAFHDIYELNAGEAEARLTANRADMTPGTRRRIDPREMLDVPFDKQWLWNRNIDVMLGGGL